MAREQGQIFEASDWFKHGLEVNRNHLDSWSLLGSLHLSKEEYSVAQKMFEKVRGGGVEGCSGMGRGGGVGLRDVFWGF